MHYHVKQAYQRRTLHRCPYLFFSVGSDIRGVSDGRVSQKLVVLCLLRLALVLAFSGCWDRALGHCSAEARALRHGTAAQGFTHHRQTAGALGHDAAVSAHLCAGLLQGWQHRCCPVKSMLHVSLSTTLLLFMWKWTQSSMCACAGLIANSQSESGLATCWSCDNKGQSRDSNGSDRWFNGKYLTQ